MQRCRRRVPIDVVVDGYKSTFSQLQELKLQKQNTNKRVSRITINCKSS